MNRSVQYRIMKPFAAYGGGDASPEDFLELLASVQGRRIDEQRASLPFLPGLQDPERVLGPLLQAKAAPPNPNPVAAAPVAAVAPADDFLDLLLRCQGERMEEQRSELPPPSPEAADDNEIFSLIMKHQTRRMDGQRGVLSPEDDDGDIPRSASSTSAPIPDPVFKQPHKRTNSHKIKKR